MKRNYKTVLFALSLLSGSCLPDVAISQTAPDIKTGQVPADSSHVMAVINDKPMTAGQLDEWARIMSLGQDDWTLERRRLHTLRALISLQAFADAARGESLDKTREFKKREELMNESTLQQLYVEKKIMTPVPDDELRARYEKEIASLPEEQEIHARHILVKTREEAEELVARLSGNEDFEKLAREKSTDGSASSGGDLGYFTRGQMVPQFEEAAFSLKAGQYTQTPIETPFGWHIIKVEDIRKKEPPSFDETRSYIQNLILRQRYEDLQKKVLSSFKVSYPDEAVSRAMEQSGAEGNGEFEDQ